MARPATGRASASRWTKGLSRAVIKVFVELYREGLIYKDKRLVNWDPRLETAISDLECRGSLLVRKTKDEHLDGIFKYPIRGTDFRYPRPR